MCRDNAVVYHDLKAKHLTVKDGMHYGADFSIYEGDADECHSYALVYVKHQDQTINVQSIVRWTRIASAANKKAILALVDCTKASVKYVSIDRRKFT